MQEKDIDLQNNNKEEKKKKLPSLLKKVLRIFAIVLSSVLLTVYLIIALMNTSVVQSFTAAKVADYFSKEWNTKVSIGALNVSPFITVGLKDVYLEDLNGDTLAFLSYLEANLSSVKSLKHIIVKNVKLKEVVFNFDNTKEGTNLDFILNYFKSGKEKKKEKKEPFVLQVTKIDLQNVNFRMRNLKSDNVVTEGLFASNFIKITDLNLRAKDFTLKGGDISLDITEMNLKERCGLNLKEFIAKVKLSDKNISLTDFTMQTDNTSVSLDVDLKTDSYRSYSSFMDSVNIDLNLKDGSYVGMKDLAFFSDRLAGAKQRVYLKTEIEGLVSDLNIKNLDLRTNSTHLYLSAIAKGLPDIKKAYLDLNLKDLTTSYQDISSQQLGEINQMISLPNMLETLGNITLRGGFVGSMSDFSAKFNLLTDLGSLDLDAQGESQNNGTASLYTAGIQSAGVNVGRFLSNSSLGNAAIEVNAGLLLGGGKTMKGDISGVVSNFYFNGNTYDRLDLKGNINNYDVGVDLDLKDDYANLQAICELNYQNELKLNLNALASQVDLHRLHFYSFSDTNTIISADIQADIQNLDLNNLNGDIQINHLNVINTDNDITLSQIAVQMRSDGQENSINVLSDILDAEIKGSFTIASIQSDAEYLLNKYIPDFSVLSTSNEDKAEDKTLAPKDYILGSNLDFDVRVKDITILKELFDLDIDLFDNLTLNGGLNKSDILFADVDIPKTRYSSITTDGAKLDLKTDLHDMFLSLTSQRLALTDSIAFKDLRIGLNSRREKMTLLAKFEDANNDFTQGRIELDSYFSEKGIHGNFQNTYFDFLGKHITLNNNHIIGMSNGDISVMNLAVSLDESKINLDGMISENGVLTCSFKDFDISLANMFLEENNIKLAGVINKDIKIHNLLKGFSFTSNLEIDGLALNEIPLGKAWLNVDNSLAPDVFNANIKLLYKTQDSQYLPLQLVGTVAPQSDAEQMNLSINMERFDLGVLNGFLASFASDLEGTLSCKDLKVRGMFSSPEIIGQIHAEQAAMKINMLGTKFFFTDDIKVDRNKLSFDEFTLKDAQGNKIQIDGAVAHNDFKSFDMDLKAVADKIKILDTKEETDQMYYGTAYASAVVFIQGDSTMINISGTAKTEPGTSLTVPVTSKESIEENNFIVFAAPKDTLTQQMQTSAQEEEKSLDYNISLDLNVNPNAKLYIPIDFTQVKGDLAAAGNGDIKIAMDSKGKFSMIGTVAIDNGKFKFNIMDLMEKTFDIEQGGTLTWNGDPAGGILDLTAIYKTKASLASILGETYSKPVDVENIINITGQMTNPQPSFDIQLPNVDDQTREQVFMNIDRSDEKVMLEQTASLLLTNQFYLSQGNYQNNALQSGVTSSVMGMAFSQLSGMLTNMVKFVDVGLNYTTGEEALAGQMDLNVGKSFGKWDLSVNATLGGDATTSKTSDATNVIGDMSAKYKYTENLQFEVFNHSNANDFTKYNVSPYTQGIKLIYKHDYNTIKDIWQRKKKKDKQ